MERRKRRYAGDSMSLDDVDQILDYIGIDKNDAKKRISYKNWQRFLTMILKNNGKSWESIRNKCRSYVGIDRRYLEDFCSSLLEWKIIELENGNIILKGIPEEPTDEEIESNKRKDSIKKALETDRAEKEAIRNDKGSR